MNHGMIDRWNWLNGEVFYSVFRLSVLLFESRRCHPTGESHLNCFRIQQKVRVWWIFRTIMAACVCVVFHFVSFSTIMSLIFLAISTKASSISHLHVRSMELNVLRSAATSHQPFPFTTRTCTCTKTMLFQFNIYNFFDNKFIIEYRNISKSISWVSIMLYKYYYYTDEVLMKMGNHWCLVYCVWNVVFFFLISFFFIFIILHFVVLAGSLLHVRIALTVAKNTSWGQGFSVIRPIQPNRQTKRIEINAFILIFS